MPCVEFHFFAGERALGCGKRRPWLVFPLGYCALRMCCLFSLPAAKTESPESPDNADLPTYSILVPVFRETSVLSQLLHGLSCLKYPALCIKRTKNLTA